MAWQPWWFPVGSMNSIGTGCRGCSTKRRKPKPRNRKPSWKASRRPEHKRLPDKFGGNSHEKERNLTYRRIVVVRSSFSRCRERRCQSAGEEGGSVREVSGKAEGAGRDQHTERNVRQGRALCVRL